MYDDHADPVVWLQAETVTLQTILVGLRRALSSRPELKAAVPEVFYHADDFMQSGSLKFAGEGADDHIATRFTSSNNCGLASKAQASRNKLFRFATLSLLTAYFLGLGWPSAFVLCGLGVVASMLRRTSSSRF